MARAEVRPFVVYRAGMAPASPLPVVPGLPFVGNVPRLLREGPDLYVRAARRWGTPLSIDGVVLVAEPDHLRTILVDGADVHTRGRSLDVVRPLLGDGLATAEGPGWLRRRRTIAPVFGRARLDVLAETVARIADRHVAGLRPGRTIRAHDLMGRLAMDAIVEALFSQSLGDSTDGLERALATIERYVGRFGLLPFRIPLGLPLPATRSYRRAVASVDEVVLGLVARRRTAVTALADDRGDLVDALVAARDPETGEPLSPTEIRDEALTIFYAGHETSANALTWAVAEIDRSPGLADRLAAEAREVAGDGPIRPDHVARLVLASAVFRETIRLHPPAWIYARESGRDLVLGGRHIPAGRLLLLSPYVAHRLEAHWPDPDRFEPERFLRDPSLGLGGGRTPYVPFGLGPHRCIGNHLAHAEAVIVLATLYRRLRPRVVDPGRVRAGIGATLGVAGGLPIRLEAAA